MSQPAASSPSPTVARALIGGLALVLAIAGQFTLAVTPRWLWQGLALHALALGLFIWASLRQPPGWLVAVLARLGVTFSVLFVGAAVLLSALATALSVVFAQLGRTNYLPVLVLLAVAGLAYAAAFVHWRDAPVLAQWRGRLSAHRVELLLLALVVLGAVVFRFYNLESVPRVINGDEGLLGQAALGTHELPLANPFALFENFGGLYMQAIGLAVKYLGRSAFALRLLPAVGGSLAVPALYLLGRQLFGPRVGLLAAGLLAVSHAHIHFSRTVAVGYIQGTWIAPLILFLFVSGLQRRSPFRLAAAGLILGLDFTVYLGAQILTAFLIVYLLVAAVLCRPLLRNAGRLVAAFWFGVMLMGLPQALYSFSHPEQFFSRLNSEGTFQSGWLALQVAETGRSAPLILLERVAHALLSLNYYPAIDFYGAGIPLLEVATGALFLLGLGYALLRTRDHRYLLLNGYFWAATVAIGVFAIPPAADSYRMLVALPAAMLLAAIAWEQLLALVSADGPGRRLARYSLTAVLVVAVSLTNLRAYYVDFAGNCRFGGDAQTRFASYLGNYLRALDRNTPVYLLSTSEIRYGTHPSVDFLSSGHPVTNVDEPAPGMAFESGAVVVAVADRVNELRAWASEHPGGAFQEAFDCQRLMLVAYHLP